MSQDSPNLSHKNMRLRVYIFHFIIDMFYLVAVHVGEHLGQTEELRDKLLKKYNHKLINDLCRSKLCGNKCIDYKFDTPLMQAILGDTVEVDHSDCSEGLVDTKTKVVFQYMLMILKRNFSCDVNNT